MEYEHIPQLVAVLHEPAAAVSCGQHHTLAVTRSGRVVALGKQPDKGPDLDAAEQGALTEPQLAHFASFRCVTERSASPPPPPAGGAALVRTLSPPHGCKYHFFVSKHEKYKFMAGDIAGALKGEGYTLWLSQWQQKKGESVDEEEMQQGVRESAALIVLLTHEIFHRDRVWVWGKEVQYAIDLGKPIICIREHSFDFDSPKCTGLGEHIHLHETCASVMPVFQPYARAIISATECLSWSTEPHHLRASIEQIKEKYAQWEGSVVKLAAALEREKAVGACASGARKMPPDTQQFVDAGKTQPVVLAIPEGALPEHFVQSIKMRIVAEHGRDWQRNAKIESGDVVAVSPVVELGPHDLKLQKPVRLTLAQYAGSDPLAVVKLGKDAATWSKLPASVIVERSDTQVTLELAHFCLLAIVRDFIEDNRAALVQQAVGAAAIVLIVSDLSITAVGTAVLASVLAVKCQAVEERPSSAKVSGGRASSSAVVATVPADYDFFVSKHEEYAADATLVAQALREAGYSVWLSNWEKAEGRAIDMAAMADGIARSAAVLLLLSPGIFHYKRNFVWQSELKPAIDRYTDTESLLPAVVDFSSHRCRSSCSETVHVRR